MIDFTALLLAASVSVTSDAIFRDGMDADACPDGRIVQSAITYNGTTLPDVDITLFENIWGRAAASDPPMLWPGANEASPVIVDFIKTGYVAAKFHVPADVQNTVAGQFVYASYPPGSPLLDLSISTGCADFSPELGGCVAFDVAADDSSPLHWRLSNGSLFWCALREDTDYYVNIRLYDPTQSSPECTNDGVLAACPVSVSNYFGF